MLLVQIMNINLCQVKVVIIWKKMIDFFLVIFILE